MPEEIVDSVVATRTGGTGLAARSVMTETIDAVTGGTSIHKGGGIEREEIAEGGKPARMRMKESTSKLLDALEAKPAPHEEGDPDEDESDATAVDDEADPDDVGTEADASGEPSDTADADADEGDDKAGAVDEIKEWQSKATRLEETNRALMAEVDAAKKTPARDRTEREKALIEADQSYIDEGSIPALRKFLSAVIGAAPDSKEVDAELAGLYVDLTERELNVPLDQSQKAMREASRAKLQLARDKRDRKAESDTKSAANSGEAQQIEQASKYVDNVLTTKAQGGTSLADEYPLLMTLAQDFDGVAPSELIARAVQHELKVGTLDPRGDSVAMVRTVAQKIEQHYEAVAKKLEAAKTKTKKTDTAPAGKAAANKASKEQRQSHGTRTITNATASVAPATSPKTKTKQQPKEEKPKFKSKKEAQDYALRHIPD